MPGCMPIPNSNAPTFPSALPCRGAPMEETETTLATPGGRRWRRALSRAKQGLLDSACVSGSAGTLVAVVNNTICRPPRTPSKSSQHPARISPSPSPPSLITTTNTSTARSPCPRSSLASVTARAQPHARTASTHPSAWRLALPPPSTHALLSLPLHRRRRLHDRLISSQITSALTKRHSSSWPTHNGR